MPTGHPIQTRRPKPKVSVTLDADVLDELEYARLKTRFDNRSKFLNYCLQRLIQEEKILSKIVEDNRLSEFKNSETNNVNVPIEIVKLVDSYMDMINKRRSDAINKYGTIEDIPLLEKLSLYPGAYKLLQNIKEKINEKEEKINEKEEKINEKEEKIKEQEATDKNKNEN